MHMLSICDDACFSLISLAHNYVEKKMTQESSVALECALYDAPLMSNYIVLHLDAVMLLDITDPGPMEN